MAVFPEMSLGGRMVFSQEERGQVYSRQREQHVQKHTVLKEHYPFEELNSQWLGISRAENRGQKLGQKRNGSYKSH